MQAPKVLVIGASWVGDMVMSQPLFALLKGVRPDTTIDVLAPGWSQPLLARMPEVRRALTMPVGHGALALGVRRRVGASLRDEAYTQAIVLPNSLKSALVPWHANIPLRTGWQGEMRYGLLNDRRRLDPQALPLMVQRFAALALASGHELPEIPPPRLQVDKNEREQAIHRLGLSLDKPVLALCPGAEFGPAKRWPVEHFAKVAALRIAKGRRVWIFGSAADLSIAEEIRAHLPEPVRGECLVLAGRTSLAEAVDLLSLPSEVVCNDSGLMHVACAVQPERPLVAVYGSTSPDFTPPLGSRAVVLRLGLACSPCFKRECPLGHLDCLRQLSPERVLRALDAPELVLA